MVGRCDENVTIASANENSVAFLCEISNVGLINMTELFAWLSVQNFRVFQAAVGSQLTTVRNVQCVSFEKQS